MGDLISMLISVESPWDETLNRGPWRWCCGHNMIFTLGLHHPAPIVIKHNSRKHFGSAQDTHFATRSKALRVGILGGSYEIKILLFGGGSIEP